MPYRKDYLFLAAFLIPPVVGAELQTFLYGLSLIWICVALSSLMVYIKVQQSQIQTDALTGCSNQCAANTTCF